MCMLHSKAIKLTLLLSLFAIAAGCVSPGQMFRRNAELKAEGYYLAEFEFKMEAALYHLNEGSYWQAYQTLRRIDHELETKEGLQKIPPESSPEELMDFLIKRQAKETGAFMDPEYPYFTFAGPTANVLLTLDTLSRQTGRAVTLKYPLTFLDKISTPQTTGRVFRFAALFPGEVGRAIRGSDALLSRGFGVFVRHVGCL